MRVQQARRSRVSSVVHVPWLACIGLGLGLGCVGSQNAATTGAGDDSSGIGSLTGASATGGTTGDSASASVGETGVTAADETTAATSNATAGGPKFDLGITPDFAGKPCTMGNGEPEFSYLWAANSTQGTISKIDTQTVTEVGRYIVRPDSNGSPSRTSVNLQGDVAVANRSGGVTKIYALPERCNESNGTPGIQTSSDSSYLAWGEEECIAWHTPFNYESQRPVAWTQGTFNEDTCQYENIALWTAGRVGQQTDVLLLDGEDGAVIDMVTLAGFPNDYYGIYGGAVDGEGNFWGTKLGGVMLVRVDLDDMAYTTWPVPVSSYGMTVDSDGYVWACSSTFGRFDPSSETWMTGNGGGYSGCMAEAGDDGLVWMANGGGVVGIDRQTLLPVANWATPGSYGVSIDYYGYVWTVAYGDGAHRIDKVTGTVTSYYGLVGAYTYSDMTGYALTNAGGGTPSG